MSNKHEVIAYHQTNPSATAGDIAKALGCVRGYVIATARRNNITLPTVRGKAQQTAIICDELAAALAAVLPEGWAEDSTMDHMPGIKQARAVLKKYRKLKGESND